MRSNSIRASGMSASVVPPGIASGGIVNSATMAMTKDAVENGNPWVKRADFVKKYSMVCKGRKGGKHAVIYDMRVFNKPRFPFVAACHPQVIDYRINWVGHEEHFYRVNPVWVSTWKDVHGETPSPDGTGRDSDTEGTEQ